MRSSKKTDSTNVPSRPRGYKFIPSAIYQPQHGAVGAYVRYHNVKNDDITIKYSDTNTLWVDTPDRELLIVNNILSGKSWRPMGCNFDEFVPFSPFFDGYADVGVDQLMINYVKDSLESKFSSDNRSYEALEKYSPGDKRVTITSDCGAFQMLTGTCDFIDPVALAKWYTTNADAGVTLDIPASFADTKLLMEAAKYQKKNSDIILDNVDEKFNLINVVHGSNLELYEKFHKVIYDKRMTSICVANSYTGNLINATADVLAFMDNHKEYDHFHILGVYNLAVTPIYIKAINGPMFNTKVMTADASTCTKAAGFRSYQFQRTPLHPPERLNIGLSNTASKPSSHDILPCQCPVCKTIKYTDVFKHSPASSYVMTNSLSMHNMFETARYTNMMNDYAARCDSKEYKEIVKGQLRNNRLREYTLRGLDMVDVMEKEGVTASRERYSMYFEDNRMFKSSAAPTISPADNLDNGYEDVKGKDGKPIDTGEDVAEDVDYSDLNEGVKSSIKLFKAYHAKKLNTDTVTAKRKARKKIERQHNKDTNSRGRHDRASMSNGAKKQSKVKRSSKKG